MLPGAVAIMVLSWIYVLFGDVGIVSAAFFGLKAAVLAIVLQAVVRIGTRTLRNRTLRAVAAIAESTHDELGLVWPREIAPADVHVVATGKDAAIFEAAQALSDELVAAGLTVLYDDRPKVSPGVKFKDAELLGMPTIVTVGRGLADGVIEIRDRATDAREEVPVTDAAARVLAAVRG